MAFAPLWRFVGARGVFAGLFHLIRGGLAAVGPLGWAAAGALAAVYLLWDRLGAAARGFAAAFKGSEVEGWLKSLGALSAPYALSFFQTLHSIVPGLAGFLKSIGDTIASIFGYGSEEPSEGSLTTWFENAKALPFPCAIGR